MLTKPLNKDILWKSKMEIANYKSPKTKSDMVLLPLVYHGGQSLIDGGEFKKLQNKYNDPDGLNKSYAEYSKKYWEGVEKRKQSYRQVHNLRTPWV